MDILASIVVKTPSGGARFKSGSYHQDCDWWSLLTVIDNDRLLLMVIDIDVSLCAFLMMFTVAGVAIFAAGFIRSRF